MKSTAPDSMTRTTFSLPVERLNSLEEIALRKKVSVSWVIRSAIDEYLDKEDEINFSSRPSKRNENAI